MTCHICPSSLILFCRGIGLSNPLAVAVATAKKNLGGNEQLALAVYENHYREGWALWDLRKDYDLQAAVVCELFNNLGLRNGELWRTNQAHVMVQSSGLMYDIVVSKGLSVHLCICF